MKTLKEYIEQYDLDFLDQVILDHAYIHYLFNRRTGGEITIYESNGSFPGQHELVKTIIENVSKEITTNKTFKISLDYDFLKELYIHFKKDNTNKIHGEYILIDNHEDYNDVRLDKENKQFKFAEIIIYNYDNDIDALEELLYHETAHIWEDYIKITRQNKFLSDEVKKSLSVKFQNNNIQDFIKDILYYSEDYEISAYISQINGVLGNHKYQSIEDAFKKIQYNSIYQNYKTIYYALNNKRCEDILLNHLSKREFTKIKKNINNAWKKIINHSYCICCDHLTNIKESCYLDHFIKNSLI